MLPPLKGARGNALGACEMVMLGHVRVLTMPELAVWRPARRMVLKGRALTCNCSVSRVWRRLACICGKGGPREHHKPHDTLSCNGKEIVR